MTHDFKYMLNIDTDSANLANKELQIHTLIVAAGKGSRFGADKPKQYVKLNDRTLLEHSVARLATSRYIDNCLIVIASDDHYCRELSFDMDVRFAIGGSERWQSVQAGVQRLIDDGGCSQDLVVIHDAARPAVPVKDIEAVIEAAKQEKFGAILATPVADTLKAQSESKTNESRYIAHTVNRSGLWQAQTPQVFRLGALQKVLAHVAQNHLEITDEASAFEALSMAIRLVNGSRQNLKLTYAEDLPMLQAIISLQ